MKSEDSNVEALSRAVLREAHDDAEEVLAKAREKADAIRQRAQEQADAKRDEILAQAKREAQRIHSEAISTAQLKARTSQLEQREKLLDEVFDAALEQLDTVQQSTDYKEIAGRLLIDALSQLGSKQVVVHADEATAKFYTDDVLNKILEESKIEVTLGDSLEQSIGVIAETPDGHRQYDNTLETRLSRFRDTLRLSVYHLLMGELL
jgi:V/A-type H+-transporting ATPase subunit E